MNRAPSLLKPFGMAAMGTWWFGLVRTFGIVLPQVAIAQSDFDVVWPPTVLTENSIIGPNQSVLVNGSLTLDDAELTLQGDLFLNNSSVPASLLGTGTLRMQGGEFGPYSSDLFVGPGVNLLLESGDVENRILVRRRDFSDSRDYRLEFQGTVSQTGRPDGSQFRNISTVFGKIVNQGVMESRGGLLRLVGNGYWSDLGALRAVGGDIQIAGDWFHDPTSIGPSRFGVSADTGVLTFGINREYYSTSSGPRSADFRSVEIVSADGTPIKMGSGTWTNATIDSDVISAGAEWNLVNVRFGDQRRIEVDNRTRWNVQSASGDATVVVREFSTTSPMRVLASNTPTPSRIDDLRFEVQSWVILEGEPGRASDPYPELPERPLYFAGHMVLDDPEALVQVNASVVNEGIMEVREGVLSYIDGSSSDPDRPIYLSRIGQLEVGPAGTVRFGQRVDLEGGVFQIPEETGAWRFGTVANGALLVLGDGPRHVELTGTRQPMVVTAQAGVEEVALTGTSALNLNSNLTLERIRLELETAPGASTLGIQTGFGLTVPPRLDGNGTLAFGTRTPAAFVVAGRAPMALEIGPDIDIEVGDAATLTVSDAVIEGNLRGSSGTAGSRVIVNSSVQLQGSLDPGTGNIVLIGDRSTDALGTLRGGAGGRFWIQQGTLDNTGRDTTLPATWGVARGATLRGGRWLGAVPQGTPTLLLADGTLADTEVRGTVLVARGMRVDGSVTGLPISPGDENSRIVFGSAIDQFGNTYEGGVLDIGVGDSLSGFDISFSKPGTIQFAAGTELPAGVRVSTTPTAGGSVVVARYDGPTFPPSPVVIASELQSHHAGQALAIGSSPTGGSPPVVLSGPISVQDQGEIRLERLWQVTGPVSADSGGILSLLGTGQLSGPMSLQGGELRVGFRVDSAVAGHAFDHLGSVSGTASHVRVHGPVDLKGGNLNLDQAYGRIELGVPPGSASSPTPTLSNGTLTDFSSRPLLINNGRLDTIQTSLDLRIESGSATLLATNLQGSTIDGPGGLIVRSGTAATEFHDVILATQGVNEVLSGTIRIRERLTLNAGSDLIVDSGVITHAGSASIAGQGSLLLGRSGRVALSAEATDVLAIDAGSGLRFDNPTSSTFLFSPTGTIDGGGILRLLGSAAIGNNSPVIQLGRVENQGSMHFEAGGRWFVRDNFEQSGRVVLSPGDAAFTVEGEGQLNFADTSILELDVSEAPLTERRWRTLGVSGSNAVSRLDGTIHLTGSPTGSLPWGTMYPVLEAGVIEGAFDQIELTGLDPELWHVVRMPSSGWTGASTRLVVIYALAADLNFDGTIDQTDLDAVVLNWGRENAAWSTGDYNGNGRVEQGDLDAVLNNWGSSGVPSLRGIAVPEPAFCLLIAAAGGLLCRRSTIACNDR